VVVTYQPAYIPRPRCRFESEARDSGGVQQEVDPSDEQMLIFPSGHRHHAAHALVEVVSAENGGRGSCRPDQIDSKAIAVLVSHVEKTDQNPGFRGMKKTSPCTATFAGSVRKRRLPRANPTHRNVLYEAADVGSREQDLSYSADRARSSSTAERFRARGSLWTAVARADILAPLIESHRVTGRSAIQP